MNPSRRSILAGCLGLIGLTFTGKAQAQVRRTLTLGEIDAPDEFFDSWKSMGAWCKANNVVQIGNVICTQHGYVIGGPITVNLGGQLDNIFNPKRFGYKHYYSSADCRPYQKFSGGATEYEPTWEDKQKISLGQTYKIIPTDKKPSAFPQLGDFSSCR